MIAPWMLYGTAVAVLLALGAGASERALRLFRYPVRWVWGAAMLLSVLMPVAAWYTPSPADSSSAAAPAGEVVLGPVSVIPVVPLDIPPPGSSLRQLDALLAPIWALASLGLLAGLAVSLTSVVRRRREWRAGTVAATPVLVSGKVGPAVVGFVRPAIVLPEWALGWDERMQRLVIEHEREHIRARDPLLLLAAMVAVVSMPWNAALWWQLRRLRLAVETDCDARVLRRQPDVRRYGALLVEVAQVTAAGRLATAAFSEPKSFLERRIRMMISPQPNRRWLRAAGLASFAALVLAAACDAPHPAPVEPTTQSQAFDADNSRAMTAPDQDLSREPTFTPYEVRPEMRNRGEYERALTQGYPATLRDAGIGGTVVVWLFIDETGVVQETRVRQSSGHEQLDRAALAATDILEFTPALNRDEPVPVWLQFPVTFQVSAPGDGTSPAGR